jgi:uncharacterized membrane protein YqjE
LWRARARIVALVFVVLAFLADLAGGEPSLLRALGFAGALLGLWLRSPHGVAVLFVYAFVELLDVAVSYATFGPVAAMGHASFALGLAAVAWVLYQRSNSAMFERATTISGALAMVVGLAMLLMGIARTGPLDFMSGLIDPDDELGAATELHGRAAVYVIALPGEGWRAR